VLHLLSLQCVTLKADGGAEWELGGNRVVQVSSLQQGCSQRVVFAF
jgi:hypothetical protein